jgi:hypothetical protein
MKAGIDDVDAMGEPLDEVRREARGEERIIHAGRRAFGSRCPVAPF